MLVRSEATEPCAGPVPGAQCEWPPRSCFWSFRQRFRARRKQICSLQASAASRSSVPRCPPPPPRDPGGGKQPPTRGDSQPGRGGRRGREHREAPHSGIPREHLGVGGMLPALGTKYTFFLCSRALGLWAAYACPVRPARTLLLLGLKPPGAAGPRTPRIQTRWGPGRSVSELHDLLRRAVRSNDHTPRGTATAGASPRSRTVKERFGDSRTALKARLCVRTRAGKRNGRRENRGLFLWSCCVVCTFLETSSSPFWK